MLNFVQIYHTQAWAGFNSDATKPEDAVQKST